MFDVTARLSAPGRTVAPLDVALRLETGKHTIVLVSTEADIRTPVSQRSVLPDGTPVTLTWGTTSAQITTWYGYVHHTESAAAPGSAPILTYVLIGTSMVLNDHTNRTWKNVTDSYVVRHIGSAAGFSVFTHKTSTPHSWVAQASESDFTFLCGLADQNGFTLWADGARMLFLNNRTLLSSPAASTLPSASMNKLPGRQDSLLTFTETKGPTVPGSGQVADRTAYGLNLATGKVISAASTTGLVAAPRQLIDNSQPLGTYAQAAAVLAASASASDQWIKADAEMLGDIRLEPGGLVWLDGIAMPAGSQGMWLIEKAEHLLNLLNDTYTVRLRLSRNTATSQAVTQVLSYGATNNAMACVLDGNNHWRAELIQEVIL